MLMKKLLNEKLNEFAAKRYGSIAALTVAIYQDPLILQGVPFVMSTKFTRHS